MKDDESCPSCYYSVEVMDDDNEFCWACCRYPPPPNGRFLTRMPDGEGGFRNVRNIEWLYPKVFEGDWCGEYRPKTKAITKPSAGTEAAS